LNGTSSQPIDQRTPREIATRMAFNAPAMPRPTAVAFRYVSYSLAAAPDDGMAGERRQHD
jgi:hypothetical protein